MQHLQLKGGVSTRQNHDFVGAEALTFTFALHCCVFILFVIYFDLFKVLFCTAI